MIDEHKRYITYILAETDVKRQQMLYNLYIDTMKMFHVKLNSIDINVLKVIDNKVKNDKGMKELLKTDATKNLCKQNAIKVDLASIFDRTEPIEDYKLVPEPNHLVKRYKCNTLKKGWEQRVSETGEIDYHNPETGKSQTERPKSCKFSAIKDGTTKFVLRDPRDPGNCDTCRVPLTDVSPGTYINENDDAIKKKRSKLYKEFDKCYEDHTSPEAFARFNKFVLDMSQRVDLLSDTPTDLKPMYSADTKNNPKYGATYLNYNKEIVPWYLDYNKAIKRKPRSFYKYLIKYNSFYPVGKRRWQRTVECSTTRLLSGSKKTHPGSGSQHHLQNSCPVVKQLDQENGQRHLPGPDPQFPYPNCLVLGKR